jgi:hypothetical protein
MVCGCTKGDDQDRSAEAHCAGYRLAVLERVEKELKHEVRTAIPSEMQSHENDK